MLLTPPHLFYILGGSNILQNNSWGCAFAQKSSCGVAELRK
jgi:hypothetical protein